MSNRVLAAHVDPVLHKAAHLSSTLLGYESLADWLRAAAEKHLHPDALFLARSALQNEQSSQSTESAPLSREQSFVETRVLGDLDEELFGGSALADRKPAA